jgi:Na+-transporting NADH:ubiquinone oxidoreductase subunit C
MNKSSSTYILGFIIVVSLVFGTGVAVVHYSTQQMLERNEQLHINRLVAQAFMLKVSQESPEAYAQAVSQAVEIDTIGDATNPMTLYRGRGGEGLLGFSFSGTGFWDRISGILVLSADLSTIRTIRFFVQSETPGLGARIEEAWFLKQFEGVRIDWEDGAGEYVVISPVAEKKPENEIDAITGASQTSMALMRTLNADLKRFKKLYQSSAHPSPVSQRNDDNG